MIMPNPTKLRLTGISKSFEIENQVFPVLENIELEVAEGQFVSVVGPSGCGKTTLLNHILKNKNNYWCSSRNMLIAHPRSSTEVPFGNTRYTTIVMS